MENGAVGEPFFFFFSQRSLLTRLEHVAERSVAPVAPASLTTVHFLSLISLSGTTPASVLTEILTSAG